MSVLPDRSVKLLLEKQALEIIDAYMDGTLKSRDEMDEEAAATYLDTLIYQSDDSVSPGEFAEYARTESAKILDVAFSSDRSTETGQPAGPDRSTETGKGGR